MTRSPSHNTTPNRICLRTGNIARLRAGLFFPLLSVKYSVLLPQLVCYFLPCRERHLRFEECDMNEHGIRIIAGLRSSDDSEMTTSMADTTPATPSTERAASTSPEHVANRHSTEQVVQRLMTEPPRRPPPARTS